MPTMSKSQTNSSANNNNKAQRSRIGWIVGIALASLLVIAIGAGVVVARAEPMLRARVIETLSTRFQSKVELDTFHVSVISGFQVSGQGLRIFGDTDPNNHEPGVQPIIAVDEFRFRTGILAMLRSPMHVDTVYINGLQLNLPPREHRSELAKMAPKGGKIRIVV